MNQWSYVLNKSPRVKQLQLAMKTNFAEINIPAGAESPTSRARDGEGWSLVWNYAGVLGANAISMSMPSVTNPGEVAGRMTFFAPVSLLFFFSVLVVVGMKRGTNLHPMNYFFLAAGCFAFQLLFGYLADLVSIFWCFLISSSVSLLLVNGYLWRAQGGRSALISAVAQFAYMVLFSYSFFFEGLTGITITAAAIVTLALLMAFTARVDWSAVFVQSKAKLRVAAVPAPPPLRS
jgi:inner membrane protein involved in colicin E2 resistance